jgi:ferritin-like metal-binding protein YciE
MVVRRFSRSASARRRAGLSVPRELQLFALRATGSRNKSHHLLVGVSNPAGHCRSLPPQQTNNDRDPTAMGLFTKDIKTMEDLFVHTLRDIYYAEKQIVKALPDMIEKATDPQLKQGFQTHLRETENHVKRLEQVFQTIGKKAQGVDCPAIDGIIKEANEVAGEVEKKPVLDAALIAAAQAVEHYEMTRYGTLISWAKQLGHNDVVALLNQTLDEERATDRKLTSMAESQVNRKAA